MSLYNLRRFLIGVNSPVARKSAGGSGIRFRTGSSGRVERNPDRSAGFRSKRLVERI